MAVAAVNAQSSRGKVLRKRYAARVARALGAMLLGAAIRASCPYWPEWARGACGVAERVFQVVAGGP